MWVEYADAAETAEHGYSSVTIIMARSHCRYVLPRIHFIPESLTYSVPLFLNRQCDRTLGYQRGLQRRWLRAAEQLGAPWGVGTRHSWPV